MEAPSSKNWPFWTHPPWGFGVVSGDSVVANLLPWSNRPPGMVMPSSARREKENLNLPVGCCLHDWESLEDVSKNNGREPIDGKIREILCCCCSLENRWKKKEIEQTDSTSEKLPHDLRQVYEDWSQRIWLTSFRARQIQISGEWSSNFTTNCFP